MKPHIGSEVNLLSSYRTGIAEVTGSNPVEALIFFRLLLSSYLNWKIHCEVYFVRLNLSTSKLVCSLLRTVSINAPKRLKLSVRHCTLPNYLKRNLESAQIDEKMPSELTTEPHDGA